MRFVIRRLTRTRLKHDIFVATKVDKNKETLDDDDSSDNDISSNSSSIKFIFHFGNVCN